MREGVCSHDRGLLLLGLGLACLVTSDSSLHKSARALMRKQSKRREEEGMHVAVPCFSVLVCWHCPCIASYSVDATDKNKNFIHKKTQPQLGAGAHPLLLGECDSVYFCAVFRYDVRYGRALAFLVFLRA